MEIVLILADVDDTLRLGRLLGACLEPGAVVALSGDLGAGKTCLTQGLAQGLGVPDQLPVTSPTFVLANEYPGRVPLYHLDVYRLSADDFLEAGLDEYFRRPGVTVVEWAERISEELPPARLEIELIPDPAGGRVVTLRDRGWDRANFLSELAARMNIKPESTAPKDRR